MPAKKKTTKKVKKKTAKKVKKKTAVTKVWRATLSEPVARVLRQWDENWPARRAFDIASNVQLVHDMKAAGLTAGQHAALVSDHV